MKIGLDIDGTVADLGNVLVRYLRKRVDVNINYKDMKNYSLSNFGIDNKELTEILTNFKNTGENLTMKTIPHSVKTINEMNKDNEIWFITSRYQYKEVIDETCDWLLKNGFLFYGLVGRQKDKYPVIKQLEIDLMIEDNPYELLSLMGKNIECICFDQPWNRHVKNVRRIKDWRELYGAFSTNITKEINLKRGLTY